MAAYSSRVKLPFAFSKSQGAYISDQSGDPATQVTVLDPVINTPVTVTVRQQGGGGPPARIYQNETGSGTYSSLQTDGGGTVPGWVDPGSYQLTAAPQAGFSGVTVYFEAVRGDGVTIIAPGVVGPSQLQTGATYTVGGLVAGDVHTGTLEADTATVADITAGLIVTDRLQVHNVGTVLPPTSGDGEIYTYHDPAMGYNWQLQYNAHSSSPNRWECIGGTPAMYGPIGTVQRGNTLLASGWRIPAVTLPFSGDYDVELLVESVLIEPASIAGVSGIWYATPFFALGTGTRQLGVSTLIGQQQTDSQRLSVYIDDPQGGAGNFGWVWIPPPPSVFPLPSLTTRQRVSAQAGTTINMGITLNALASTSSAGNWLIDINDASLQVRPIRVSN